MVIVVIYAGIDMGGSGARLPTVPFFQTATWYTGIGFAVYSYEGIGIIMPV